MSRFLWAPTLLMPLALAAATAAAAENPTSRGPAPAEEATVLWDDGSKAFAEGRHRDAVNLLSRLVARHPAAPGATEAYRMLGLSHLTLGEPAQAVSELRQYVEARDGSLDGQRARIALSRAYLKLGRKDESLLAADTVLKRAKEIRPFPDELRAEAMIAKGRAMAALGRRGDAEQLLDLARKSLGSIPKPAPSLRAQASELGLQLKLAACAAYPSRGRMDEAQARDQLGRRGDCLKEAALLFRETASTDDGEWGNEAYRELERSYESYHRACLNPPDPPGKRTRLELKRYRAELLPVLRQECGQRTTQAIELIENRKDELSPAANLYIKRMADRLRELKESDG